MKDFDDDGIGWKSEDSERNRKSKGKGGRVRDVCRLDGKARLNL